MSMKADNTIGNQTRKLLACSSLPQITKPSHAPNIKWLNNKVLKNGLAHKPIVTGSFSHVMTTRDHSKERASSISSSIAPPLTSCIFLCWHVTAKADTRFVSNLETQQHKNMKMKLYFLCISWNGLKDSDRHMRTMKISKLLAAIRCPKSRMWYKTSITGSHKPLNRRIINCTLTRRQLGILEKQNLCCPYWEMNARLSSLQPTHYNN
jgi:hypothetical protein